MNPYGNEEREAADHDHSRQGRDRNHSTCVILHPEIRKFRRFGSRGYVSRDWALVQFNWIRQSNALVHGGENE